MSCCGSCGFSTCRCGGSFTTIPDAKVDKTLFASLACVADQLRDIETQLGARDEQVRLVWVRWSGGERGYGVEEVIREELLTPPPTVSDYSEQRLDLQAIGTEELGKLKVTDISARYEEDFLMGRGESGEDIPKDQSFYWELRSAQANGLGRRRRYVPSSPPNYNPYAFGWSIKLLRASEDRTRDGEVRG
jgi:hypothetical protein